MTANDPDGSEGPGPPRPSSDVRARRSRERLIATYIQLTNQTGAEPTVTDLVRAAGVNASTFYAHFHNLTELTLYVLDSALTTMFHAPFDVDRTQPTTAEMRDRTAAAIVAAVQQQREPLRAAVRNDRPLTRKRIGEAIARNNRDIIRHFPAWSSVPEESLRLMLSYLGYGWSGVICAWLADDINLRPDELAAELVALNPDGPRYLAAVDVDHQTPV